MRKLLFFLCLTIFFTNKSYSKSVLDVVSENKDLSIFYSYLQKTGLDRVLKKKLPWNWTIFAPNNKAFNNAPDILENEVLNDDFFSKNIFMDHIMTGHKTSLDVSEQITTQITVSNKPLQIYKSKKLHVKDMVVVKENLIGNNGVVHIIDCIMFVQPSKDDDRVSDAIGKNFPITSCCMQSENEISAFKNAANQRN
mgnify:CR=1 FL=1